jgi:AI-2 transport protein TqsA
MPEPTDPEATTVDRPTEPASYASWAPGDPRESELDSKPRVSLGPLSIFGFGADRRQLDRRSGPSPLVTNFVGVAALIIVIAALREAKPVLLPLVVSAFGATLTAPIVFWLRKKKVPAGMAVPVVVVAALIAATLVAGLIIGSLNAFIQEAPTYRKDLNHLIEQVSVILWRFRIPVNPSKILEPGAVIGLATQLVTQLADLFSSAVLILLITVLLLFEVLLLPAKIRTALGDPHADLSQGLRVVGRVQEYVVVKTYTSLSTGVIIGGLLYLQGIDFALLWGLFAFLLDFIPSIGAIIAAVPAVLLALLQKGPTGALFAGGTFFLVNVIIGNFVEPRVMGRRMNLSPLVVFASLMFWGWMWGPLGMILSVPLTMVLRILLEGNPATRPIAILMAAEDARPVIDLSRVSNLPLSRRSKFPGPPSERIAHTPSAPPRAPSIPPPPPSRTEL